MKNYYPPEKLYWNQPKFKTEQLVKIPGFGGYYIGRFNDIFSFCTSRPKKVAIVKTKNGSNGQYTLERIQLFDDDGRRRNVAYHKLLKETLGIEEYWRRENNKVNREDILERERRERIEQEKKAELERQSEFQRENRAYAAGNNDGGIMIEWQRLRGNRAAQDAWVEAREKQNVIDAARKKAEDEKREAINMKASDLAYTGNMSIKEAVKQATLEYELGELL